MPKVEGGGTVYAGGPGTSFRGPLYVKAPPVAGKPAGSFTYQQIMDAAGSWALQIATVTVSSAQIKTLFSAPLDLSTLAAALGAPGAGNLIALDFIVAELKFGTVAYTAGGAVSITYGSGGPAAHTTAMPAALVTAAQSELFQSPAAVTTQQQASAMVNVGLFLAAATANFATGDGTLQLTIGYRIFSGF